MCIMSYNKRNISVNTYLRKFWIGFQASKFNSSMCHLCSDLARLLPGMLEQKKGNSSPALLIILKSLTVWITTESGKFLKRWGYQITLSASWKTCMLVKKQLGMEQKWTASKLGKEYIKAVYCHPVYLNCMQISSWEMPGLKKDKLKSRLQWEISVNSDIQMLSSLWHKAKKN